MALRPGPRWGVYGAPTAPLAVFQGPTSKGREGREPGVYIRDAARDNIRERSGEGRQAYESRATARISL